ncbi:MAG: hypothetical protein IMZ53_12875 [Thermoplasmata archaeon]|nr:hypothetical protein [Thermoplasmata archaeon]
MQTIIDFLSGKKSYIILIVGFIFNVGVISGWWVADNATWQAIDALLVTLLGMSFRAAVTKSNPEATK